jgi:hypothetical protein
MCGKHVSMCSNEAIVCSNQAIVETRPVDGGGNAVVLFVRPFYNACSFLGVQKVGGSGV